MTRGHEDTVDENDKHHRQTKERKLLIVKNNNNTQQLSSQVYDTVTTPVSALRESVEDSTKPQYVRQPNKNRTIIVRLYDSLYSHRELVHGLRSQLMFAAVTTQSLMIPYHESFLSLKN